jgi:GWxTD domain-containing protein
MKRLVACIFLTVLTAQAGLAQPEFYADPFIGYPEFRVLPLRLPAAHPDSVRLEVHVRVLYDDLQFIKTDSGYEAGYSLDVLILDADDRVLASYRHDRDAAVATYSMTNSRQYGDQTRAEFALARQDQKLRVSLRDRESRKDRILEKQIEFVPKEWGGDLKLGDLALLDSTGAVQMSTGFLSSSSLFVAYNLYVASTDSARVDLTLLNQRDEIIFAEQRALEPQGQLLTDTVKLPTQELKNGNFRLVVKASQGQADQVRFYPFKILWQNLPDYIQDFDLAVRQLKYIATDEEMDRLLASSGSRREELFQEFWKKQDPTPVTSVNERMEEYYRRVRFANDNFSGLRDGWETDMGRVYVIFGAPSDVERHPFDIDKKPYEYWYYYDLNRKFLFVDEDGFGEFRLKTPIWHDY